MERIIDPVSPSLIQKELTPELFLCKANNGGTEIYHFTAPQAPNTLRELGRLREEAFRDAGGGTGKPLDLDDLDTGPNPYHQLIVWDPEEQKILGGYRYSIPTPDNPAPQPIATAHLFKLSPKFEKEYLPYTIELGRSFVQVAYQSSRLRRKGLYALDNLWDGLGALVVTYPDARYFFGKVTMYTSYNQQARNALMFFLQKYFNDPDGLVEPIEPLDLKIDHNTLKNVFVGENFKADLEILNKMLASYDERIPPLIRSYMNLSSTMRTFGTAINHEFGDVEETGILVTIPDIYQEKIERHTATLR